MKTAAEPTEEMSVASQHTRTHGDEAAYGVRPPHAVLIYLAAPAFLFLLFFAQRVIGLGIATLLAVAMVLIWRRSTSAPTQQPLVAPAAIALLVAFVAGFPNGPFCWDWVKHWALINELADHPWPFSTELQGEARYLRFYLATYLVPAGLHQVLPALPTWAATGAWFTLGFLLVFQMVASVGRTAFTACIALLLFLALGGADAFAEHWYRAAAGLPSAPWLGIHFEGWEYNATRAPLEYSSMLTALCWVPHQSIAAFLVAGLLVLYRGPEALRISLLGYGLLALWSPYAMIGLAPVVMVRAAQGGDLLITPRSLLEIAVGSSFAVLVAWYLSTDLPGAGACFVCLVSRLTRLSDFFVFWAVELSVFVLILRRRIATDPVCLVSFITLLVIPLLYGNTGDFVMRGSMGPLFILAIRSTQEIVAFRASAWRRAAQVTAICLCAPAAASEMAYQVTVGQAHRQFPESDPLGARWVKTFATRTTYDARQFFDLCGWRYLDQYFSKQYPRGIRLGSERQD